MTDPTDIRAWQRLSDRITTSGRLLPDDPARLAALGVKRIVNLALDTHPEALADEANICTALGISYTHIPIPFDAPQEGHFDAFRAVIDSDDVPTHVHCIANWRVSACFYRYNRDIAGMAEPEARALMIAQWDPETSDYPGAAAWAAFIAPEQKRRTIMTDFAGRHVIVTGASSGIGLATARLLVARGAKVSMIARRAEVLAERVDEMGTRNAAAFAADVGDRAKLEDAIAAAVHKFGPVYGLFANAGLAGNFAPATDYPSDLFEKILKVNLTSVFWAMQTVLPAMIEARSGAILITGSMASKRGMAMNPAYVASKHGVLGLSRAIAVEMAPHNVRCNCIIPGFIETPAFDLIPEEQRGKIEGRVPQRRMGSADELAEVAVFMLSPAASHVTAQDWAVDGGTLETLEI